MDNPTVTRRLPTSARSLTAIAVALLAIALAPSAAGAAGLTLGFNTDPPVFDLTTPENDFVMARGTADGARIVRVNLWWSAVAPARRNRRFRAANPASPAYRWSGVDALVQGLAARGLQVMINISYAPTWAEGPQRPRKSQPGTWKPDPVQYALFAKAAARRYDGTFAVPGHPGLKLPRVHYWQAWNEPNLGYYLSPQWTRTRRGMVATSPDMYRQLLNGFYAAVKGVSSSNVVVEAGVAPYGNRWGVSIPGIGYRMQPVTFDRLLFARPTWLDVVAQHLYPYHGPLWHAASSGDVAVPELHIISRVMGSASRAGRLLPRGPKHLWVTELSWNSDPPDAGAVPLDTQALWYEQALYELWRQGVHTVLLLQLIDPDMGPWEGGIFFGNGQPKPAATAFQFPFVTVRSSARSVLAWGRAPVAGQMTIERRAGSRWTTLATLSVGTHQVFERMIAVQGRAVLRARLGLATSLPWIQVG